MSACSSEDKKNVERKKSTREVVHSGIDLPDYFDPIAYPDDNPYDPQRAQLGEQLFNDVRLSYNNTVSCASCHFQDYAFSDTAQLSKGVDGQLTMRNSPPLFNLFTHTSFFRDGGSPTLELQVVTPIESPEEMNINIVALCEKLDSIDDYHQQAQELFGTEVTPYVVSRSLANYMRTLVSHHSRYDAYLQGNKKALTEKEKVGLAIFEGKGKCIQCHMGPDLRDNAFYNIGLYETYSDTGMARITLSSEDHGRFKVPSLRNVAITGPYMHDGSLKSLEAVIGHFNSGGIPSSHKSNLIEPLGLNEQEQSALKSFLLALTDTLLKR